VAGVWLRRPSLENWRAAFRLAQDAALRHTEASELVARSALGVTGAAAEAAGMRLRARAPVFLFRKRWEAAPLPLQFQMSDNDAVFLAERATAFLT
jgi:hypothetical protein